MAGSIWDWSSTADDNGTADSDMGWPEGMAPGQVNNSARVLVKRIADLLKDLGGVATAGGTANALTLASANSFTSYADGLMVSLRAASANTDEATLNVNAVGTKPIVKMTGAGETVLSGGEIQADGIYELVYSEDLNGAAGAWLLSNPSGEYVPSGLIAMWSGTTANVPSGWLLCDGANGTPDLTDRFIVGAGSGTLYDPGDTGGANSVALTTAEMPSHTHGNGTLTAASAGAHNHSVSFSTSPGSGSTAIGGTDNSANASKNTSTDGAHTHNITGSTSSTGSGDAHENRPPYYALAFIMKT